MFTSNLLNCLNIDSCVKFQKLKYLQCDRYVCKVMIRKEFRNMHGEYNKK